MKGWKTYTAAFLMFILAGAKGMGWVSEELYQTLLGLIGALGLAALRDSVKPST